MQNGKKIKIAHNFHFIEMIYSINIQLIIRITNQLYDSYRLLII
jgi:hypothetical protein